MSCGGQRATMAFRTFGDSANAPCRRHDNAIYPIFNEPRPFVRMQQLVRRRLGISAIAPQKR
jgi:hypothetical protein